jgi:hypothetical protein
MKNRLGRHSNCQHFIAAVAVFATTGASAVELAAVPLDYRLTIIPGQYVIGSLHSADIARVEAWLRKGDRHLVAIDLCASATTPQLLTAVEKLEPYTSDVLEIRKMTSNAAGCTQNDAASADGDVHGFLRDVDYMEIDEFGYGLIP